MKTYRLDFMRRRHVASALSVVLLLLSLGALAFRGLELGIEFTGGALFDVRFPDAVSLERLRTVIGESTLPDASLQYSGSEREVVVRLSAEGRVDVGSLASELQRVLALVQQDAEVLSSELIGPAIGDELRDSAGLGALASFAVVGIYIMFRFAGKFAIGATVALVHDVVITLGFFAITRMTFDMPAFAAVLAIIGYSLNDTIVVYDRVRENLRSMRTATPVEAINRALNQTLERTLAMSATTMFTVLALLLVGGDALRSFSTAMAVGVVVGTYSSIYVASSLLLTLGVSRLSLLPAESGEGREPP